MRYVALVNAGAGIASRYYDRFAAFLAENGVPTLVYDYRGIGRSRPHSLRGFNASVEDWGSKDCAAAISWLQDHFPQAKILVVGHSIGGFVTGFVTNGALIDKMLLIGAHTGYWRDYSPAARPLMLLLWHVLMPAITSLLGYFPGKRLHLLEDLPKGVALEWAGRLKARILVEPQARRWNARCRLELKTCLQGLLQYTPRCWQSALPTIHLPRKPRRSGWENCLLTLPLCESS